MSDCFFDSLMYGTEIAMQIQSNMEKICNECGEKCSPYMMMHRGTMCDKMDTAYDGIDFSKAPTPEQMGMVVIDEINGFQIVVAKGTELDKPWERLKRYFDERNQQSTTQRN